MSEHFEELDFRPTAIGTLALRRRRDPATGAVYYEIKLGDEFLMSSLFTASEAALADLPLAELDADQLAGRLAGLLDVVVGGLGLGYTAAAVLKHNAVGALLVIEFLEGVVEWHRDGLVPLGPMLSGDPRCRIVTGDFFAMAASRDGFDPQTPGRRFDAVLLDIDHSPDMLLDGRSLPFYSPEGLAALMQHLKAGGIFALWSNDPPDARFTELLSSVCARAWAAPVTFHNPLQNKETAQTVYLARRGPVAAVAV